MSDNRQWIKWWTSIVEDAKFQNIRLDDIGRYGLLLALVGRQGERGKLTISPPAHVTLAQLRCQTIEDLISCLKRLPNVQIDPPKHDYGDLTVTILKWYTYQVDSTAYKRVKRLRIREDKKRKEKSNDFFLDKEETPKWM